MIEIVFGESACGSLKIAHDNKHQHNTDLVEITLRSRLNPHHFGGLVGIYGSLHGR